MFRAQLRSCLTLAREIWLIGVRVGLRLTRFRRAGAYSWRVPFPAVLVLLGLWLPAASARAEGTPTPHVAQASSTCNAVVGGSDFIGVTFTNESDSTLTLKAVKGLEGEFLCAPPQTIAIGEQAVILSIGEGLPFPSGTEFTLVYELEDHSELEVNYDTPLIGDSSHHEKAPTGDSIDTFDNGPQFTTYFGQGCGCDGIPDVWKRHGVTIDPNTGHQVPNGTSGGQFIDLPKMGVSLDRPNVLVQMDWMEQTCPPNTPTCTPHNQHFDQAAIDKVIEAYDKSPVTYQALAQDRSGATRPGITLIVDNGEESTITPGGAKWGKLSRAKAVPWKQGFLTGTRKNGYDTTNFSNLLKSNFIPTGRVPIFNYAVAVADISSTDTSDSTSGLTPSGYGFIASLGDWPLGTFKEMEEGGTFMHEEGHVLGFGHGGEDSVNEKPNYSSVMNYFYDPYGVRRNGEEVLDYSRETEPNINESTLTEKAGLSFGSNPLKYETQWWCPTDPMTGLRSIHAASAPAAQMDWNCDGTVPNGGSGFDVNNDGSEGELSGNKRSDWERIGFLRGGVGTGSAGASQVTVPPVAPSNEITTQIAASLRGTPAITYTGALSDDFHDPVTASATLTNPGTGVPVGGASIAFKLGAGASDSCNATTNALGTASCTITPTQQAGSYSIEAAFAGNERYLPVTVVRTFGISPEETTLTYTGPTVGNFGTNVTLTGNLVEDGSTDNDGDGATGIPIANRTLIFNLGRDSCSGTTDATGNASCTTTLTEAPGIYTLTTSFAGDANYGQSSTTASFAIHGPPVNCAAATAHHLSGYQGQPRAISGGTWCYRSAEIDAPVTIAGGASVLIEESSVNSTITAKRGGAFALCASTTSSRVTITEAKGFVVIGDPSDDLCGGNELFSSLSLAHNAHAVELAKNTLWAPLTIKASSGSGTFPEDQGAEIEANSSFSSLSCSANSPVSDGGEANIVYGIRGGQCKAPF